LLNRLTGKYLEIPNASTTVGTAAGQWDSTSYACQRWNLTQTALPDLSSGQYFLVNKNSTYRLCPRADAVAPARHRPLRGADGYPAGEEIAERPRRRPSSSPISWRLPDRSSVPPGETRLRPATP
jgi:hypothetical protein